ncbi:uncharacterized protein LOC102808937 [Saccoglossus kowalevskii]|uniref:Extensin-like n=1 Tax=Saccoglossus kowalevskii TaxID=10224 RepID=A0ABM0LXH9_SACKO|nr:PREDICTED: extensin-like [Saccoglossus kowalevskii]
MADHRLRQRAQSFIITGIILIIIGIILEAILWWFFYIGAICFIAGVCLLVTGIVWHCQSNRGGASVNVVQVTHQTGPTVIATSTMHSTIHAPPQYPPPMYGAPPQSLPTGPTPGYMPPTAPPLYGHPPSYGNNPTYYPGNSQPVNYTQPPPNYSMQTQPGPGY